MFAAPDKDQAFRNMEQAGCQKYTGEQGAGGANNMPVVRNNSILHGITCRTLSMLLMIALFFTTAYPLFAKSDKKNKKVEEDRQVGS